MMTYNILIQPQPENVYRATVLGWPDLSVVGDSEQTVLKRIKEAIRERLAQGRIVQIEVEENVAAAPEHPWLPFLGMWKDDPTFDDFIAQMEAYRRELDEVA
jgi:predicted RNase H-like HicB family nuclease